MNSKKTILVAPLNWGLGHATRCIPIIQGLLDNDYKVLLASDGEALDLLRKEFADLPFIELPSYNIKYSNRSRFFKLKMILNSFSILNAITSEKRLVKQLVSEEKIDGIISDNRLGVRHKKIPSVFVSHQITVLSGSTTFLSTLLHQAYIKKFNVCWVPDVSGKTNLSGKLSHFKYSELNLNYIGVLSRMKKVDLEKRYDCLILLSGPEPQRTLLQERLLAEFKNIDKQILFVLGKVEAAQKITTLNSITIYNFMLSHELEIAINESETIIARSGYTTLMDMAILKKKLFLIPTPGQYEQEYLAKYMQKLGVAPFSNQEKFTFKDLNRLGDYSGFTAIYYSPDFRILFTFFEGK